MERIVILNVPAVEIKCLVSLNYGGLSGVRRYISNPAVSSALSSAVRQTDPTENTTSISQYN